MTAITWRPATADDLPAIAALLADDDFGATRETRDAAIYAAAFARMQGEPHNQIIVGLDGRGALVGCYQLTFITGLALQGARRAQIEGVRIAADRRGQGLGRIMFQDAETRARAAGCKLLQLTTNAARSGARAFYEALGFTASHIGFKRDL
jgi:GNAT superfamily N-acetyltransferase